MTALLFEPRHVRLLRHLAILVAVLSAPLVAPAHAQAASPTPPYRYHLVSLTAALPPGFAIFDAVGITADRRIYGTGYRCDDTGCLLSVMVYHRGKETILHDGVAYAVNDQGTVGGSLLDPATGNEQAAVFRGTNVRVIPRLPGETTSHVIGITNTATALVMSVNAAGFTPQYFLYDVRGKITPLNFGPGQILNLSINDRNIIAGTIDRPASLERAFRYDATSGVLTTLDPVKADPQSGGQGINQPGDVLGYSFTGGGLERIGVWRHQTFQTYFVEGTREFPTISNSLLWNRKGLIVITNSHNDPNSYLVPEPHVRIKLADVVDTPPVWTLVKGINARGDLIGSGGASSSSIEFDFLLERVGAAPN
jgi:hypothetical protein